MNSNQTLCYLPDEDGFLFESGSSEGFFLVSSHLGDFFFIAFLATGFHIRDEFIFKMDILDFYTAVQLLCNNAHLLKKTQQ